MSSRSVGLGLRSIRIRMRLTQAEVSIAARVPRRVVQSAERGRLDRVRFGDLERIAGALDASVDATLRWRGGDLPRLVNARHAALHEVLATRFGAMPGWVYEPEVSFAYYAERGVVDGLAWHEATRSLLLVELKSELVDISELMGTADRKRRLAPDIVRARGWQPTSVSLWVAVGDSRTNHRELARHGAVLRSKFPADGRTVAAWLAHPIGRLDALSLLPLAPGSGATNVPTATRLVRRPREVPPDR